MSVSQLHPEELLDKEAHGTLTEGEGERLKAHLAQCPACRLERLLRADFSVELEGGDSPALAGLLAGALSVVGQSGTPKAEPEARPIKRIPRIGRPRSLMLAAALLCIATGAAAASSPATRSLLSERAKTLISSLVGAPEGQTPQVAPRKPEQPLRKKTPTAARAMPPSPNAPSANAVGSETSPATAVPTATVERLQPRTLVAPPPRATQGLKTARPDSITDSAGQVPSREATQQPIESEAELLFAAGGIARREGNYETALQRYRELERRFPESREASAAHAIVGRLLLDRGDPSAAGAELDSYLSSGRGELREQALAQRALSFERLGHTDDEVRAWKALLAAYPGTRYGTHARGRLTQLAPP